MKKIFVLSSLLIGGFINSCAQPGQLDSSFGDKGIVINDFGTGLFKSKGRQVLAEPGGGMYVTFQEKSSTSYITRTYITKRNANGQADKSYGRNGFSDPADISSAHSALQADGKLVMAGSSSLGGDFIVFRFNADGKFDSTFGKNGKQVTDFRHTNDLVTCIAIQGDGKIVVAGFSYLNNKSDFAVARYNSNDTPDKTFSKDGKQITDFGGGDDFANSVVIQPDGKIVAAGEAVTIKEAIVTPPLPLPVIIQMDHRILHLAVMEKNQHYRLMLIRTS